MPLYLDPVTNLQTGSVALLKSFQATDGSITATYRGRGRGKRKEKFVVLLLGVHVDGDKAFEPEQALNAMGFFRNEKRKKPAHPNRE